MAALAALEQQCVFKATEASTRADYITAHHRTLATNADTATATVSALDDVMHGLSDAHVCRVSGVSRYHKMMLKELEAMRVAVGVTSAQLLAMACMIDGEGEGEDGDLLGIAVSWHDVTLGRQSAVVPLGAVGVSVGGVSTAVAGIAGVNVVVSAHVRL